MPVDPAPPSHSTSPPPGSSPSSAAHIRASFSSSVRPAIPNIPPRSSAGTPINAGAGASPGGSPHGSAPGAGGYGSISRSGLRAGSLMSGGGGSPGTGGRRRPSNSQLAEMKGLGEKRDPAKQEGTGRSGVAKALAAVDTSREDGAPGESAISATESEEAPRARGRTGSLAPTPPTTGTTSGATTPHALLRRTSSGLVPAVPSAAAGGTTSPNSQTPASLTLSDIPDSAKAEIVRRHLVSAQERLAGEAGRRGSAAALATPPSGQGQTSPGSSGVFLADDRQASGIERASSRGSLRGREADERAKDGKDKGKSASRSRSGSRAAGGNGSGVASAVDFPVEGDASSGVHIPEGDEEIFPVPFDAPGGDITHGIYKWQNAHRPVPPSHRRALSFSAVPVPKREDSMTRGLDPSLAHIRELGGFRRAFVQHRAEERGEEGPRMLRSFVDFLFLYGHFAGEDLDEEDDDSDAEDGLPTHVSALRRDARSSRSPSPHGTTRRGLSRGASALPSHMTGERAPLLGPDSRANSKTRHRRTKSMGPHGDATVTQAVLMLLKGFVGTGVLFLGKAFFNGGILFSAIVMLAIAGISLWSFLLLVKTRLVMPGGFGEIGGALYGNYMRTIILTSIALSQIGFVAAYTIFVAENMQAFVLAVSNCRQYIEIKYLIAAQLVIFLPLSMIRNLAALSSTALIADAFILVGLIYIGSNEVKVIATKGIADVALFNANDFSLLIGTAVFAFEGIGLVIPITESMREPHKFPKVLSGVMAIVAILFTGFGVMGYAAYGSDIQTVVIVNLPQDQKFVQVVQCLYSVAILLSAPLQLFPAVRIMETSLFSKSGKHNPQVKWQKNLFRACTVIGCSLISWAGASNLDGFVSIIGSFACIPLCFIYPPMLHLRARAQTRRQRVLDYMLITFGVIAAVYTTIQTARVLLRPSPGGGGPKFGKCDTPSGH